MKIIYIWKLIRKMRRIRIRYPHTCQRLLAIWTWNRPPPVICLTQVRNRENIPGLIPPSTISCSHTLDHTWHNILPCHALCYIVCFVFTVSSPSFSLDRPQDRHRRCCEQLLRRRPDHFNRASRQAFPPFDHPDIAYFLSTACIRVV